MHRAEARYEEWNQCRYTYDEFIKKERAKLEKEKQADLSTKARGKQRADEPELPEAYFPQEHLIPDETTRRHVAIAREATTSGPTLAQKRRQRFDQFKFNADQLRDFAHSARTLVRLASDALDARFGPERVLGGSCFISAKLDGAGRVVHACVRRWWSDGLMIPSRSSGGRNLAFASRVRGGSSAGQAGATPSVSAVSSQGRPD